MGNAFDLKIEQLVERLDAAVLDGRVEEADKIASMLFRLQGGTEEAAVMPEDFPARVQSQNAVKEKRMKPRSIKKIIYITATAAIVMAVSITAVATGFFGVRDLVIRDDTPVTASAPAAAVTNGEQTPGTAPEPTPAHDLIVLQGYPDSPEYKAAEEWNVWQSHYDEDGSIIAEVGNSSNEYTERYPMYLVYSKDMADMLEEIVAKYGLTLHQSMTVVNDAAALIGERVQAISCPAPLPE
jgi:hypothetical protein